MDFSVIDELFNIYKDNSLEDAKVYFMDYLKNKSGLINLIKEYINLESSNFANFFVSNKDEAADQHVIVNDIIFAFENIMPSVQFKLNRFLNDEYQFEEPIYACRDLRPHDLFKMDINFIEAAVREEQDCFLEDFYKIKDFLLYVKKHRILSKIYKDGAWEKLDFEDIIYNIYDYLKDKSIFKSEYEASNFNAVFLFEKIKEKCYETLSGVFDKFRPNLNSKKQIPANFDKLIFCRNLMLFYETGIMPDNDGLIDFSSDSYEKINIIDRFKKLYSKAFKEETFRENQGNFICNPEVYNNDYKLEASKCVVQDNTMINGFLVSCGDSIAHYLVHIEIKDVNNPLSSYEMQVSVIPQDNIEQRIQLIRLDNIENDNPHRNIAKKLQTRTHVHLYNEFDLLRGETNASFDIAYNLKGKDVLFEESLKTFLEIVDFDCGVSKEIYNKVMEYLILNRTTELSR